MYRRILVAVENSPADRTILTHVTSLAALTGAELLLVHVADGFAARHFKDLNLRESEEIRGDRDYLSKIASEPRSGIARIAGFARVRSWPGYIARPVRKRRRV